MYKRRQKTSVRGDLLKPHNVLPQAADDFNAILSKVRNQWSKFSDQDLQYLKGDLDFIEDRLQNIYGYSKERAHEEYREFKELNNIH